MNVGIVLEHIDISMYRDIWNGSKVCIYRLRFQNMVKTGLVGDCAAGSGSTKYFHFFQSLRRSGGVL